LLTILLSVLYTAMKPKLLIVDDAKTIHLVMADMFKDEFTLFHASNLSEARKHMSDNRIDLILLDVNLDNENGFDFCKEIRGNGVTDIPIIFITASNKKESVLKAFEVGGDDFIEKPFERAVVKTRIQNLLDAKSAIILKAQQENEQSALSMLATLSHEIINPLTMIKKEILSLKKREEADVQAAVEGMETAVKRISTALEKAKSIDMSNMSEYSENLNMFKVTEDE